MIAANSLSVPPGVISSIVVPGSLRVRESLKLLTRMSPRTSLPTDLGANTIPYGFTSPFAGTVVVRLVTVLNWFRNGWELCAETALALKHEKTAVAATAPLTVSNRAIAVWRLLAMSGVAPLRWTTFLTVKDADAEKDPSCPIPKDSSLCGRNLRSP